MKYCFTCFLFSLLLLACQEPPIVFSEAQPQGQSFQQKIPLTYQGLFLCESDSALVHINGKTIYKEMTFAMALSQADFAQEELLRLEDDQVVLQGWPQQYPAEIRGDSIFATIELRDTLFHLSKDQVLKQFRGHQILNIKRGEQKWEVLILSLDDDRNLRLSMAFLPQDLERLQKITPVTDQSTEDYTQWLLRPNRAAFKKILQEGILFQECDLFTRLRRNLEI